MMKTIAFSFALFLVACGGDAPNPNAPTSSSAPVENPGGAAKPGGPGCTHMVGSKCFADKAAACKEAGCAADACTELETMPMKVACKK